MRTTLTIDAEVLAAFKHQAAESHETLSSLIEAALREHLARQRDTQKTQPVYFPVVGGQGPAPGLDLSSNAAVLRFLDEAADATVPGRERTTKPAASHDRS